MKKIIVLITVALFTVSANAQNWTKETYKDFKKNPEVALVVDLSHATIMGVSIADYPEYYAGKFSSTTKYATLVLQKFQKTFKDEFYKYTNKKEVKPENAKYTIIYEFSSIGDKGGFSGKYHVTTGDNKSEEILFTQKDGRWNNFEELLMENVKSFYRNNYVGDPYYYGYNKLYKKSK